MKSVDPEISFILRRSMSGMSTIIPFNPALKFPLPFPLDHFARDKVRGCYRFVAALRGCTIQTSVASSQLHYDVCK